jgi:hypothetical protein
MKLRFKVGEPVRELTRDERYAFLQGAWLGFGLGMAVILLGVVING